VNGNRPTSTVAPQALFFLNSPLILSTSESLAMELLAEGKDNEQRIRALYERVCNRPATDQEIAKATDYLARVDKATTTSQPDPMLRERAAWASLCQVLLASNEFNYIR
jgi:hypothetical protein